MANARPPGGGSTPRATIGVDLSQLRAMPAAARAAGQATAREMQNALKEGERAQAASERQRTTAMQATLTQRRVAVRVAAREEIEATRQVAAQQAAAERQRLAEMKAALRQRVIAVKAAAREEAQAQRAAQASARAFRGGVSTFAGAALGGPLGGLAGAVAGGPGGAALAAGLAVSEGARFALEATATATAYNRQNVAALQLAGSQAKLNDLLRTYERVTGGAVDRATALSDVTRLMAVGFADTAAELEEFVRAARGISVATGQQQDYVISQLQLAIANQSTMRLDQLGLGVSEVKNRIDELKASNSGLTDEMAYQQAVLGLAADKFGALVDSTEAQATGAERLTRAWRDMRLEIGQEIKPDVDQATSDLADLFDWLVKVREANRQLTQEALQSRMIQEGAGVGLPPLTPSAANRSGNRPFTPFVPPPRFAGAQIDLITQRWENLQDIAAQTSEQIEDIERSGGAQRASVIRNYEKSIAREAEDFARQRANAERKLQMSILDVAQDSARQRAKWERDLSRNIAEAQADSAERIDDARKDTNKRLAEIDEDFKEDQARREEDFRDDMLSAAGRLDAIALLELRKGRARELEDAKKGHEEQRSDLQAQLQERIDEERDNLQKSIDQQRDAHARQVQEQAENDRLRIQDMKDAFEEQKAQEDIERGIRLSRQAEDHADQLIELDRQQGARIQQIREQAAEQRAELEEQFELDMADAGKRLNAIDKHLRAIEKLAIESFDRTYGKDRRIGPFGRWPEIPGYQHGGFVGRDGPIYAHRGEFMLSPAMLAGSQPVPPAISSAVTNNSSSRSLTIAPGAIVIQGTPGMDEAMIANIVVDTIVQIAGER